jgi:hypothetical protein
MRTTVMATGACVIGQSQRKWWSGNDARNIGASREGKTDPRSRGRWDGTGT